MYGLEEISKTDLNLKMKKDGYYKATNENNEILKIF